jgi:hypothetical protein
VKVYFNYSYSLYTATPTLNSGSGSWSPIGNSNYAAHKVIGANAAGNRLVTLDTQGTAYIINPDSQVTGSAYGFGLDNAESAMQVRQEVSGDDDAYIAIKGGSSLATTGSFPIGPIFQFDLSVSASGLQLTSIGAFYSNNASGDLVLFSANDGQSDDMYIVTSHTAGQLWGLVGFFGSDTFLPPAPTPAHLYTFDVTCSADSGTPGGWNAWCNVTPANLYPLNGSSYGPFEGSSYVNLGSQTLPGDFTLSAWVYIPGSATGQQTIVANVNSTANQSGFWLYVDTGDSMKLKFSVANGSSTVIIPSSQYAVMQDNWNHIAVSVSGTAKSALLYINGALVNDGGVFSWEPTITAFNTNNANIYWGTLTDGSSGLTGYLENLRIHLRELSPQEVLAEMLEF